MYFHVVIFQKQSFGHTLMTILLLYVHIEKMSKYNDLVIHKIFDINDIFDVAMEINATSI